MANQLVGEDGGRCGGPSRARWLGGSPLGGAALLCCAGLLGACTNTGEAPPPFAERHAPEALFLVHNEVLSIRLDGTDRHSLGQAGDDRYRTGWPRRLPDGRAIVLADDTGAIFPFFSAGERFLRIARGNVTLNDSLCGVLVGGEPRMVLTSTPFVPTRSAVERLNVDDPSPEVMHVEPAALIAHPAPYDDGRVIAVRSAANGTELVVIDVAGTRSENQPPVPLAFIKAPYFAASPARLPDGRVAFIHLDSREMEALQPGELWVIEADGRVHATGLDGIINLVVVEDRIVYEAGGTNRVSDLVSTDLVGPPVNVTNTPFVSEHLGWSD